ncbi:hypothetical protein F0L68_07110 [Solihabitans fulvus]|uniref:Uncharacterized protein n=1 Tax=Solihabitans fulvus TaxID=1892852 RepID=A0A5B2XLU4_9PSEU|nr:hypothetical protein [Solihabitans fulvus]KAA2264838.1 hypothetical protein F0L68_07110 [Solihabitans fulvus]
MTAPQATDDADATDAAAFGAAGQHRSASLNQPRRAIVAVVEVLVVALLVFLAVQCWRNGVIRYTFPIEGHDPLPATRFVGSWMAGAVALGTAAGIIVLDAVRQLLLAMRVRPGRRKQALEAAAA